MNDRCQHSPCLLLVEDNDDSRDLLARLLRLDGWEVCTAQNGADGLDRLNNGLSPSVIVTDFLMPRLDGLAMLDRIRSDPSLPNPPAVVVSALDLPLRLYAARAEAYFKKPLDLDGFRQTLVDLATASKR